MGLFTHFSNTSRQRKLQLFDDLMKPSSEMKILDLGAEIGQLDMKTIQFIDSYPWKVRITAANISPEHVAAIRERYPQIQAVEADALNLPWPDKYFDIVYSNAVIEHVGNVSKQKQMAAEIMRVGRRWFVTTPNRWYPFEFHLRLPFVTWLPGQLGWWVGCIIQYNHVQKRYTFMNRKSTGTRLISARQLQKYFPDSKIIKQRITFWPETLIAFGGEGLKL